MKILQLCLCLGLVACLLSVGTGSASAGPLPPYVGELDSSLGSPTKELTGTGAWVNTSGLSVTINWIVSLNANGTYNYYYVVTAGAGGAANDLIIQTSANFTLSDITGCLETYALGTWSPGGNQPNMPASVYGLDFTSGGGVIQFNSDHAPTWGDFYAVGGTTGGQNSVWNTAFTSAPLANPPGQGELGNELLVPDGSVVPEPATASLFGLGLVGLVALRRRK